MSRSFSFTQWFWLSSFILLPVHAHAGIELIVFDSITTSEIAVTDAGHSAVYLSNICMTETLNKFRICTPEEHQNKTNGIVVQREKDMSPGSNKFDWIALPLNTNLYGTAKKENAPILATQTTLGLVRKDAYENDDIHLSDGMKPVKDKADKTNPEIPHGGWQYAIGSAEMRTSRRFSVPTSADEDNRLVKALNSDPNFSHYNGATNNCANFANHLFQVAKGKGKDGFSGKGFFEDLMAVTPLSMGKAVKKEAKKEDVPYVITTVNQTPGTFRSSVTPTELSTDSNSNMLVSLPLKFTPSPVSYTFSAIKLARKLGMPIPGYRPYMDLAGKEVQEHGSEALAEVSYEIDHVKKHGDASDVKKLKADRKELQNDQFGTKSCWNAKRKSFNEMIAEAIAYGVVDVKYEKEFKMHEELNKLMRLMPMAHLTPNHAKLIDSIANAPGTEVTEQDDGFVIIKDGVTAGLSRSNIDKYDPKLGFLVLASSIVYQLDSSQTLDAADFDQDWKNLIALGKRTGLTFNRLDEISVQSCSETSKNGLAKNAEIDLNNKTCTGSCNVPNPI
jgi:hypothetical protein